MKQLELWIRIALVNLVIVALLGLTLRGKMVFSMPFLDFKYILHAHSHFAFGGWITLALLALMTYRLLPVRLYEKPVYKWLLAGILVNAYGMLFSFPFQGYAFYSILFSTLFIFTTYGYAFVFTRDILKTQVSGPVKLLATGAVAYMALSSAGAFTLAYLLATKSQNLLLYKDAIYTYLHLQYNGFFTLGVFALVLHYLQAENRQALWFARLLHIAVIPSMFMSYLWHYPDPVIRMIAVAGSLLIVLGTVWFFIMLRPVRPAFRALKPAARPVAVIAMASFVLKMIFQALTIIPALGPLVFANRPVIIGFLHLVLLGFVSLCLLAYFIQAGLLPYKKTAGFSLWLFIAGILINEVVLFTQGLGFMLMMSSALANWLLLAAACCLFAGALLLAVSKWRRHHHAFQPESRQELKAFRAFSRS